MRCFRNGVFFVLSLGMILSLASGCSFANKDGDYGTLVTAKTSESPKEDAKTAERIRLKIFTQYTMDVDEKQPFDYAYTRMKKDFPEVELEIDIEPQDDSSKLKIYAASGCLPDIIQVTKSTMDLFRASGNLLPLDRYVKDTGIEDRILPVYRELLWDKNGNCYAIPRTAPSTHLLFYNKELFNNLGIRIPTDYNEFLSAVKAFRSKGITPLGLFGKETWPGVMLFEDFITRYEPQGLMKVDQGMGSLKEMAYKKAAEQLAECVKAGMLSKNAFLTDYDAAFEEFTSGKAAVFLNGCWALGPLGEKMGDKLDFMDFPFADRDTVKASSMNRPGGGFDGGYSVSVNTKHKDLVGRYTCLFSLEIANGRVVKAGAPNPLTKDGVEPERGYPAISVKYAEQAKHFKTTTVFPWALNSKTGIILGDNCAKLLTGDYPVGRFIEDTDREIEASRGK